MNYVLDPAPVHSLAIAGSDERFPVNRIFCVGRNYAAHAREMGGDPTREAPFFFTKPADALVPTGSTIAYPSMTSDLHHEIELVVALGGGGREVSRAEAPALVFGYAVGLDLTRRDLQNEAKKAGRPWDMAKGFDQSAPLAPITPVADTGWLSAGAISLTVNGALKQKGDLADMVWDVAEVIADLSRYVALAPGDLIYTGTPEGVGAVVKGDRLHGRIDGLQDLEIVIG